MAFVYWIHLPEHTDITTQGYVGFTSKTVEGRLKQHYSDSTRDGVKTLPIYRAFEKYKDKLVVDTLVSGDVDYCLGVENKLRPSPRIGWNIKIGGDFGSLGVVASEATKQKMSEDRKGVGNAFFGKHHSEETKLAMSISRTGRFVSDETKLKQSIARKGVKRNLTPDQRLKISLRSRAQVNSPETRAKISKAKLGRRCSEEIKLAMRERCRATPWLNGRANKTLWASSDDIYNLKHLGFSIKDIAVKLKVKPEQLVTINKKIVDGWTPSGDILFTTWLATWKENDGT